MGQSYLKGVHGNNPAKERFKIYRGKKRFLCDYRGNCENISYAEVYPDLGKQHHRKCLGWSYLCEKHFQQEYEKHKFAWCPVE